MREMLYSKRENVTKYEGFVDDAFRFIEDFQLINPTLWRRFVQQFREDADYDAGWRGEYWGKMMRGACLVYPYTQNPVLYETLVKTVRDMMDSADEDGRISSYGVNHEFDGWDIWSRKYVLLGMQYFLEICKDEELKKEIIASMSKQVDYIISKIGKNEDGKLEITSATRHWRGLNSSSLLEPIVRLYNLTGEKKYFDFAEYIVNCGGTDVVNIFDLAYEDQLYPYQYPVTKAYEMTSCFEGLLEFYKITGIEKYKTSIVNFANKILESDFTVIGSCGCTHELFDHSTVRQANTTNGKIAQETCVTVTLMKFLYRVFLLTGDSKYADAFEIAFYNAYLGAINTDKVIEPMIINEHPDWSAEPLPFDSYSPLTAGTRGNGIGGLKIMSDNHYYGCCACIGAAGIGLVPKMQLLNADNAIYLNMFINGSVKALSPMGKDVAFNIETKYPKCKKVNITVDIEKAESFKLCIRKPYWSKNTVASVNGQQVECEADGYISIDREWSKGDVVYLELDMRTEAIYPIPYGSQVLMNKVIWGHNYMIPTYDQEDPIAHRHIALRRGPVMLAQENRLGYSVDDPISVKVNDDGYVSVTKTEREVPYNCIVKLDIPLTNGNSITVTDYSSAGKTWTDESKMAVWMLTE